MNLKLWTASMLLRKHGHTLSDEEVKIIHGSCEPNELAKVVLAHGVPFNEREIELLIKVAGDMDEVHSFARDGHRWTDDTLQKYADYVHNYKYTYKPEAQTIDATIDTEEEHIGPMAQDLEKVNPATVKEDLKTGYKTVDTGRLALMNAGAIADLAREVQELKNAAVS